MLKYEPALLKTLHIPAELPEVVASVTVDVIYTAKAVADGHPVELAINIAGTMQDLEKLLLAGFLSRPFGAGASTSVSVVLTAPNQLRINLASGGVHINIVPVLIRLMQSLHQTPGGAFAELVEILGEEEASAVYGGINYADAVQSLSVNVQPMPSVPEHDASPLFARRSGMPLPGTGPLVEDRQIDAGELRFDGISPEALSDDLEDAYLSIAMFNAFVPIDAPFDFTPGEEEFFFDGASLVIHNISIEQVYLFEFLNCLAGGSLGQVTDSEVL